jgi:RNAse (barnase) inhibitor barstar
MVQQKSASDLVSPLRFSVVNEDGDLLCRARNLEGFFVARVEEPPMWDSFIAAGCSPSDPLGDRSIRHGRELGNGEVRILDEEENTIGAYYVGGLTITERRTHPGEESLLDIAINGLLFSSPHPLSGEIWERWRSGKPETRNQWVEYPPQGRVAWLEVVRLYCSWHCREVQVESLNHYELDGEQIIDPVSFYCALGEAINGPGGYFGADLDALNDCLRGGFGAIPPFNLVWRDSQVAREYLGTLIDFGADERSYFDTIIEILTAAKVRVDLQ